MSGETSAPGALGPEGFVPLAIPNLGEAETQAVLDAVRSSYVSSVGPAVEQLEADFAALVGKRYAVACATGTAALHVALRVLGVEAGSEVWCADFTFAGSANPIHYLNARPLFIDSEPDTWNIDPALVVDELNSRARQGGPLPAAIELVHILGQPAKAEPILNACAELGIPVVEDAAESLGAGWSTGSLAGRATGAVGTIGCFSFNGNKIVTAGGGGMIVTDDEGLAKRAKHLTTQAKVPDIGYLHDEVGYNYRLSNLAAALVNAQLGRLDEFVQAKHHIAVTYDTAFADLPIVCPPRLAGFDSSYWLYSILTPSIEDRNALLDHLNRREIGARALWRPMHLQPPFASARFIGSGVGTDIFERGVSLPSSTQLTDPDQQRVVDAVRSYFGS